MIITDPKALLASLSTKPGIYQMRDSRGKVIYVGKARNIQKRVSSYFRRQLDTKTQVMMVQVDSVETTITRNENEALLLEASVIKQLRPRYNVLLRDDKSYPYLYLSTQQPFPRLDFYRGSKRGAGRYFGPYPSAGSVRENLALIQKLFQLRQCSDTFFNNRSRPCLQYQIKRCTAPCVGYVSESDYRDQVDNAILFLEGKNEQIMQQLTKQMQLASKVKNYEQAAHYRDQIAQLRRLQKQQVVSVDSGHLDVIGVSQSAGELAVEILFIRAGRLIGNKAFFPNLPQGTSISSALAEFIPQYYLSVLRSNDIPKRIVLSQSLSDRLWIQNALSDKLQHKIMITDQKRAPYKQWQRMAALNAEQALSQRLAQKNTFVLKLQKLQQALELPNSITRVECFDISHTMGEATVASCVVFAGEGPIKKDYRRFNIKGIKAGDDYAALHDALMRRYTRLKKGEGALPDLLIIDGGKGQLTQAVSVLEELQVSGVTMMAIAKGPERKAGREKIFIAGRDKVIHLAPDDMVFHLLQHIRDEAHRFAITGHRARRAKKRSESPLQEIDGVGPKRRQQLLNFFGGWQGLEKASIEEIAAVSGISDKLAKIIYEKIHRS